MVLLLLLTKSNPPEYVAMQSTFPFPFHPKSFCIFKTQGPLSVVPWLSFWVLPSSTLPGKAPRIMGKWEVDWIKRSKRFLAFILPIVVYSLPVNCNP